MRFLAIDYGTKRVGLAICDETEFGAFPLATIARSRSLPHDLEEIARRAAKEEAQAIVFGLPLNADDTTGKSAQAAEEFARALSRRTPLNIYLWDEFLTTAAAEEELIAQDVSRKRRRAVIDQMAAVQLLESFLQARRLGQTENIAPLRASGRGKIGDAVATGRYYKNSNSSNEPTTWRTEPATTAQAGHEIPSSNSRDNNPSSRNSVAWETCRPAPPQISAPAAQDDREDPDDGTTAR